jgi:hypothetical protein
MREELRRLKKEFYAYSLSNWRRLCGKII